MTFFGVLMAGGFYAPLHPDAPEGRVRSCAETLGGAVVIAGEKNLVSSRRRSLTGSRSAPLVVVLVFGAYGVGYIPVDPMYESF